MGKNHLNLSVSDVLLEHFVVLDSGLNEVTLDFELLSLNYFGSDTQQMMSEG